MSVIEQLNLFQPQYQVNVSTNDTFEKVEYSTFKNWLYQNYPQFIDTEIDGKRWQYKIKKKKIEVYIGTYYESDKQFVSASYDEVYSGSSYPCDTYGELKEKLDYFFEKVRG